MKMNILEKNGIFTPLENVKEFTKYYGICGEYMKVVIEVPIKSIQKIEIITENKDGKK